MATSLQYKHGTPLMVDYTPGSDVTAGEVVNFLGAACIAHNDIPASTLGAVAWPNGSCVYEINEGTGFTSGEDDGSAGDAIYFDAGSLSNSGTGNQSLGTVMAAYGSESSAPGTRVVHEK